MASKKSLKKKTIKKSNAVAVIPSGAKRSRGISHATEWRRATSKKQKVASGKKQTKVVAKSKNPLSTHHNAHLKQTKVRKPSKPLTKTVRHQKAALQKAVESPISKKNTWFYVSVSMVAFFLTLAIGTLVNPGVGTYLQASLLAASQKSEVETLSKESKNTNANPLVRFTLISRSASTSDDDGVNKLQSMIPSLIPTAQLVHMEADSIEGQNFLSTYNPATLPFLHADASLSQVDLFLTGTISNLFNLESDGTYTLKTELVNPNEQVLLSPLEVKGLRFAESPDVEKVYAFTDFKPATKAFYYHHWSAIQNLIKSGQLQWIIVPLLDENLPIETEAALALACVEQLKPHQLYEFHRSLLELPNLTAKGIERELSRINVKQSSCSGDFLSQLKLSQQAAAALGIKSAVAVVVNQRILSKEVTAKGIEKALGN